MNINTANRLMEHRKSRNFSQEELSSLLGVSRQAISKWERGEASPDTDKLIALAGVYQISLDDLLGLTPVPPCPPELPVEVVAVPVEESVPESPIVAAGETTPDAIPSHTRLSPGALHLLKMVGVVFWAFCFVIYGVLSMFFPNLKAAYPVLCALIYLVMGFGFHWWHPGWIIFLTIPLLTFMF